jgi:uncharacterized membrane protein YGL010W
MGSWFERSLAFYASYHHNDTNKLIHIFFVWPIFFTAQVFLFYAGTPPAAIVNMFPAGFDVNWTLIASLLYATYYFLIEQPGLAGPLASALVMTGYAVTKSLVEKFPSIWIPALVLHIFAWISQIYGHQVYEKRAPAFLDNIVQALVMAPLFVLLEVLFPLGYKANLHKKVEAIAVKNIDEYRNSLKKTS